tara:strand:- start:18 stop:695 length:678 start_codon:yes stop_codon:yes gene_type:complete
MAKNLKSTQKKRFWEDLTTLDFSKADAESFLAIMPIAAIEQHGPHLPVGVDSKIIEALVKIISEKLSEQSNAIFLPTFKVGKSNEHLMFPGTLSLSTETLYSSLLDIGKCLSSTGIRKLAFLNSHGGNISLLDVAARELRIRHQMLIFNLNWFGFGMPPNLYSDEELKFGIHAGDLETSVMLAVDPKNVQMEKAKNFIPKTVEIDEEFQHIGLGSAVKFGWQRNF